MKVNACLLVALLFSGGIGSSQELKINRETRTPEQARSDDSLPSGWVKMGSDLFAAHYRVPRDLFMVNRGGDDPFGGGGGGIQKIASPQKVLESMGITFGEGCSAEFYARNSTLRIINSKQQLELVDVLINTGCGGDWMRQVSIRTEIYELPILQALQLLESAEAEGDHRPERDAALAAVRAGSAKLVTTHSLVTTPGQRAKIDDVIELPVPAEIEGKAKPDTDGNPSPNLALDIRPYGTSLEVEPNIDADGETLSLNIAIEHHTGEPQMSVIAGTTSAPSFHAKKITTNIVFLQGDYVLLGTWKPTGRPEYGEGDLMHVVFATANLQTVGDYGRREDAGKPEAGE